MLSVDRDANAAVETRIQIGWNKFKQFIALLTNKDISLTVRGRLYSNCVRSSMLHGSETWPIRKENKSSLESFCRARCYPDNREWTHPLHVLLAAQYPLQTNPVTQPRVRYIHTTLPDASYTLHGYIADISLSHPPNKRNLPLPSLKI